MLVTSYVTRLVSSQCTELKVVADYENPRDKARRIALRGDGASFTGLSRECVLDSAGSGPLAQALNEKRWNS